jgi:GNAT superfamily N-acetyltransferase
MIVVERATEDDYSDICAIDAAEVGDYRRSDTITRAILNRECLVARRGADRLGFAVVNRAFFGQFFIEEIVVHPDARRRGVGRAIMQYAERTCPQSRLFTSTPESNIPMQRVCAALGYVRSGYIDNVHEGEREIIFVKFLTD